jgi:hypothetical protein
MEEIIAILKASKLTANAVVSMYRGAATISNIFLAKKIEKFGKAPFSKRGKKFIRDMNPDKFEKLQEQIIHSLTQAESVLKALYIKKLTEAYCEEKINWLTFCRMNFILNQIYTFDLKCLVMFYNDEIAKDIADEMTQNKMNFFAQLGLMDYTNIHDAMGESPLFEKNEFGRLFIECVVPDLDEESPKKVQENQKTMLEFI